MLSAPLTYLESYTKESYTSPNLSSLPLVVSLLLCRVRRQFYIFTSPHSPLSLLFP